MAAIHISLETVFEFLQKVFLFIFVCALGDFLILPVSVLRQIARYLPHSKDARFCVSTKTHPKSSHDKFKTVS